MDRTRWKQFEAALRENQAELAAALKRRDGIEVNRHADLVDEIQSSVDQALLIETLDHTSAVLREVQSALARIAEGEYGLCANCGEQISAKRLAAAPWAPLCLRCQEEADRVRPKRSVYGIAA